MALLNIFFDPKGNVSCFLQNSNESLSPLHSPSEEVGVLLLVLVQASKRPDRQIRAACTHCLNILICIHMQLHRPPHPQTRTDYVQMTCSGI